MVLERVQRLLPERFRSKLLALALAAAACPACAGPVRQLHPVGGDEFTLFPAERSAAPPPVRCAGDTAQRFACFAEELQNNVSIDSSGAFAIVTPDGKLRSVARTDALNEQQLRVTEDTRFPVASITKMFLGAASVSLAQDGALDLQQPIARYVPELASDVGVGQATLHQLLTHTAGLGGGPQCEKPSDDLADVSRRHGRAPLLVPPGEVVNYSNLGYSFVAIVLERVTGKPFEQVVKERVLVPAGLPGATFGPDQVAVRGHRPALVEPRCRALWPSGGLVLSVRELAQWAARMAHPDDSPLGRVLQLISRPQVELGDRPGSAYGYGVRSFPHAGHTIHHHAGRLEDFSAFVAWSSERQLAVAAVANRSELFVVAAAFRALSTFLDLPADWQPPPGPAHALGAYTGVYVDRSGTLGRLQVSLEGEALVMDYLDGPPPLLPAGLRFVFEPGAARPRHVVTPVGVGVRSDDPLPGGPQASGR